jgi:hypothetical protein
MKWLAVVEDYQGSRWFSHRDDPNIEWELPWFCQDTEEYREYDEIHVVKVVWEGVSLDG